MPKFLEMSANVGLESDSKFGIVEKNEPKKVQPYYENGKCAGYVITSPKTGRNVLVIESENRFNENMEFPSFENSLSVPQNESYPEEHFAVLNGIVIYLASNDEGGSELVDFYELPECRWQSE